MSARTTVLVGMIIAAALTRLVPHPPNFTPILAIALFGAAQFRSRWAAFLTPLVAMVLSDVILQFATPRGLFGGWLATGTGFYEGMWVVYGTIALTTALGLLLRKHKSVAAVTSAVLANSILFFLITNFAVWAGSTPDSPVEVRYEPTLAGLLLCYEKALPFFGWTLAGTALYAAVLFGGLALAERRYPALQPA